MTVSSALAARRAPWRNRGMPSDPEADIRRMRTSDIVQTIVTYSTLEPRTHEEATQRQRIKELLYAELDARVPARER